MGIFIFTVFTKPPFEITESGYAGFMLLIEIQFKNKEEPRKVVYNYDLFLNLGGPAKSRQTEKLIFKNPGADFKKKLLKSGGVSFLLILAKFYSLGLSLHDHYYQYQN